MCKMSQSLVLVWWGKGSLEEAYVTDSDRASDLLQENKIKVVKDVERQLCWELSKNVSKNSLMSKNFYQANIFIWVVIWFLW